MTKKLVLLTLLILAASCRTGRYTYSIRFPYQWLGTPGLGGNIDKSGLVEPSGICFHPSRKTLFVVSDEGEVMEMTTEGVPVFRLKIPGDLEGITVHPKTGMLYIVHEGVDIILEVDPDKKEVTREFPLNREYRGNLNFIEKRTEEFDNGLEDIVFVANEKHPEGGTFYLSNQWDPPCIMEVLVPLKSSRARTAEARILRVLPFQIFDPAAMYYDPKTRRLNVVSDADNILVEITLEGKLIRQYAFLGDNQEGIARDDKGFLYIAQDSGGILKVKDLRK